MHSRNGFSGSPVFVYRTFGSDLSEPFGHAFDDFRLDFANPRFLPKSGRLKARTHFNFLGIHWRQFPEEWELKKGRSKKEARRKALITEGEYVKGMSGMTCVIPAWQILEV